MNLTKIHLIVYRIFSILLFVFLMIGSEGLIEKDHIAKGAVGAIAGIFMGYCISQKPALKYWIAMVVVLLLSMCIIGYLK